MNLAALGALPGKIRKVAGSDRGERRVRHRRIYRASSVRQEKATWRSLFRSVRLGWTGREFGLDRIGFGQAIHSFLRRLRHFLFGQRDDFALATFHFVVVLLFSGYFFGALLPAITISGQIDPPWSLKCQNSGSPETAGVLTLRLCDLKFYYVLGLSPFGTLNHLKLHFLVFRQGAEAVALDGTVMHKYIRTALPGDKRQSPWSH